ncbi:MAG TPA: hypothetical protein VLJ11_09540 [Bryobacteraceae bacterium]|nr:hypothetical protein [Bryobacteraceae bacterium]
MNGSLLAGFILILVTGVLADMIANRAMWLGNSSETAGYAVWPVAVLGGLVSDACYATFLLSRKRTWKSFHGRWHPDVLCGIAMGILWMGAFALYGVSSILLGTLAAWALIRMFMIMTATCSGFLTAEWRGAPRPAEWGRRAWWYLRPQHY